MGLTVPQILPHCSIPKLGILWGCLTLAKPLCVIPSAAPSQSRGFPHHENQVEGYRGAWQRAGWPQILHLKQGHFSQLPPAPETNQAFLQLLCMPPTPTPTPRPQPPPPRLLSAPVPVPGSLTVLLGARNSLCLQPAQGEGSPQHAHF